MACGYGVERRAQCTCKLSISVSWNDNMYRPGVCVCVCVFGCVFVCWVVGDALTAAADMTCVTNIFFLYYLLCLKCIIYDMPLSCCMHSYIFLYATINDMRNLLHKCNIEGCCEKVYCYDTPIPFCLTTNMFPAVRVYRNSIP